MIKYTVGVTINGGFVNADIIIYNVIIIMTAQYYIYDTIMKMKDTDGQTCAFQRRVIGERRAYNTCTRICARQLRDTEYALRICLGKVHIL